MLFLAWYWYILISTQFFAACDRGSYKDVIGNGNCVACPFPLHTTASTAAPSLDNCNVCRYTGGTYPTDTGYCKYSFYLPEKKHIMYNQMLMCFIILKHAYCKIVLSCELSQFKEAAMGVV